MVLWEKVNWKEKKIIIDERKVKRKVLFLLLPLINRQFIDTIRPLINIHFSRRNSPAFKPVWSINLATSYHSAQ